VSTFDNDSRVHKVGEDMFRVFVDGDRFTVFTDLDGSWLAQPPLDCDKCARVSLTTGLGRRMRQSGS
jgi:hypothetical protein